MGSIDEQGVEACQAKANTLIVRNFFSRTKVEGLRLTITQCSSPAKNRHILPNKKFRYKNFLHVLTSCRILLGDLWIAHYINNPSISYQDIMSNKEDWERRRAMLMRRSGRNPLVARWNMVRFYSLPHHF